jgi:hypothetical protein
MTTELPEHSGPRASSVILIREWEQQMSSSSCCGRLAGDLLSWTTEGESCFPERRRAMEQMGRIYRSAREQYGENAEVRVVDPRNLLSLIPLLLRDFRRYRVGVRTALRTISGITVASVVVNGRLVPAGGPARPIPTSTRLLTPD